MQISRNLEYAALVETLRQRGWEVTAYDEILARRDDTLGVWTVAIDRGGRVRFTATRPQSPPEGRRLQRDHRRYRLLIEQRSTLTVTTRLETVGDLAPVLDQIAALVRCPESWAGQRTSGTSIHRRTASCPAGQQRSLNLSCPWYVATEGTSSSLSSG